MGGLPAARAERALMYEAIPLDNDELLAKLAQIQEQAQLTLDELPQRLAKERLRLIIGLARYLQNAVALGATEQALAGQRRQP
jgi:hypothetical protein